MSDEIDTRENENPDDDGEMAGREPVDIVEGPVGSASLREPSEIEREDPRTDADALPTPD